MKLAVIADDLTGANDTGVQFAKQGLDTTVLFPDTMLQKAHLDGDVIVLNSNSRALPASNARKIVADLSKQLHELGITSVLKKIDSTMRGNIGSEIDAVMDVYDFATAFVVPAFPKSGRMTLEGIHYVDGVPLDETETANDPTCPVKKSYLPGLLEEQSKRKVELISIRDVREGSIHLASKMKALSKQGSSTLVVVDAETDDELHTIVEAAKLLEDDVLWVGSAGIAYHLCNSIQERARAEEAYETTLPILMVAGSISAITHKQVEALKKKTTIQEIIISPDEFLCENTREKEIARAVELGKRYLDQGDVIVSTKRDLEAINKVREMQKSLEITNIDVGNRIADALGVIAGRLIDSKRIQGAVLTGGDIAGATCKVLNGKGIRIIGEVEDGLPYGELFGGQYDRLPLATKAGSFGSEQALVKALETLRAVNQRSFEKVQK
ncbi:four-carbon acid sugar kinase family protein [Guptibacillus algicola]|uniref:four-carbon acid sugar kinase family protein n=1 Tax=Guptibacillus algicola TaxID=225844 RepID=UPI001CD3E7AF|nr:four-carbon acid sugar kinase family protein [Alkalihalobacillus algicola]MCA0987293.1 four-carbon acid sugar kinase family protein [Alkalihalobacillus algicola]